MKTNTIKVVILLIVSLCVTIASCTKAEITDVCCSSDSVLENNVSLKNFASVLSKAVYENKELRLFIKEQALEQFDKDYDVFYPFVKNEIVADGKTFRDIILQYSTPSELGQIEQKYPMLNILVPDWAWIGCFSINSWDATLNDVCVGYDTQEKEKPLFFNGEEIGQLPELSLPTFATLIVKNNERMKLVSPQTKGGEVEYAFKYEDYDNTVQTKKVHPQYYEIEVDGVPDVSNFMPASSLDALVIDAYKIFGNDDYGIHRDHIYYGMTKDITNGKCNPRVYEVIKKIKFRDMDGSLFDDSRDDFIKKDNRWEYEQNGAWASAASLRDKFYAEGNVELNFYINVQSTTGTIVTKKHRSFSFGDLFALEKADLELYHKTWFTKDKFIYTIKQLYFHPRWCDVDLEIEHWDLSKYSSDIYIRIEEEDPSGTETVHETYTTSFMKNFSASGEVSGNVGNSQLGGNVKVGLGYGTQDKQDVTIDVTGTRNIGSDDLGTTRLTYNSPVIMKSGYHNNQSGYYVKTINTGSIDLMVLPVRDR